MNYSYILKLYVSPDAKLVSLIIIHIKRINRLLISMFLKQVEKVCTIILAESVRNDLKTNVLLTQVSE